MNKPWLMISAVLLIGLLSAGLIVLIAQPRQGVAISLSPPPTATPTGLPIPTRTPEPILVQIGGAVQSPGVYPLLSGSRSEDLIEAAGGLTADADLDRINWVALLRDGAYFYCPIPNEPIPETAINAAGNAAGDAETGISYPINLNAASQEELESLPGIGPSKAADILSYRDSHGPFSTLEDLANVPGIGAATVESLKEFLIIE